MKYISNALYMVGIISAVIGIVGLITGYAHLMLSVYLMSGGVIVMGISNILTELCEWWEDVRYGV